MIKSWSPFVGLCLLAMGCNGLPGIPGLGECKFGKGELAAELKGDAKAFVEATMEAAKLQADWNAEMKAMAGTLKVEGGEEAVLAKLTANFESFKAEGKCTFEFSADVDLKASLEAAAGGSAGTDGASGDASGSADASVSVDVKIVPTCEAEAGVKADLDLTVEAIKVHLPKLLGIAKGQIMFLAKVPELAKTGAGLITKVATDLKILPEVKCAVEELTGFKANLEAKVDFSVKVQASASAEGEAKTEG